jgi:hypothetical protein
VNPTAKGSPFWTPITPRTGSFFHAESHPELTEARQADFFAFLGGGTVHRICCDLSSSAG